MARDCAEYYGFIIGCCLLWLALYHRTFSDTMPVFHIPILNISSLLISFRPIANYK